jgi:signal transduction histidine kinase
MQGMKERAQMVGGSLELRPREGGGTEVLLEIPMTGERA